MRGLQQYQKQIYVKHLQVFVASFFVLFYLLFPNNVAWAVISCAVTIGACTGTDDVIVFRVSATSNAHAEIPSLTNYTPKVCCTYPGITNSCSGNYAIVAKLSATTNAHLEENTQSNYANNVCIGAPGGYHVTIAYQNVNCTGYDTIVTSMSASTNAHTGNQSAYTGKICATIDPPSLTLAINDAGVGFGNIDSSSTAYATGDSAGSATEVEAHRITASSNASGGYIITVNGLTLKRGAQSIAAIGATNTAPAVGTEQFGMRLQVTSGTGTVTVPYAASGFAFDTASFPDQIASGVGDDATTIYSVRYMVNASSTTKAGGYTTDLTYIATGTF